MLLIHTQVGQSILINDNIQLKLLDIDFIEETLRFELTVGDHKNTFFLKKGVTHQVLPKVAMICPNITQGANLFASLGFDAPRDIRIKGEWLTKRRMGV